MNDNATESPGQDFADVAAEQWRSERPDLNFSAMAVLIRLARLGLFGGRLVDQVFAAAGLDRGEFNVLAALRRTGRPYALTPSQLADEDATTRGGMTKRIDKLEARGLVERVANGTDRRSHLITLTAKGFQIIDELIVLHTENETRLLAVCTAEELALFDSVVRKLLSSVDDVQPRASVTR